MKKISALIVFAFLTACGGSGSGGSSAGSSQPPNPVGCTDPAANNYSPAATVDDGSCTYGGSSGGNGNASYYGFKTDGSEIQNDTGTPTIDDVSVLQKFYFKIVTPLTRAINVGVYQPTCPMATYTYYSAVLISDTTGPSAVTLFVNPYSASTKVTTHSFREFGTTPNWNYQRWDAVVGNDSAYTCANGKITDALGREIYANGEVVVMKDGSNIYFGMAQNRLETGSLSALSFSLTSYNQSSQSACSFSGCVSPTPGNSSSPSSPGGVLRLDTVNSGVYNGYFGTPILRKASNGASTDSTHYKMSGTNNSAASLIGIINGYRVIIGSMTTPANCQMNFTGNNDNYCSGSTAVTIGTVQ